ncbi:MAG: hypothetical protein JWQ00_2042 [Noviherbaspirillum sp.]|nr:hypothetical protein [Noviherbaspirillum sp.]
MDHRAATFDFLACKGEMSVRMRTRDWSGTSLGAPASWPPYLRRVVGLALRSKFPMFVLWGEEMLCLYNDAYIPILGARHPAALGKAYSDIFPEAWPDIEPIIGSALAGESSFFDNMPVTLTRYGHPEPAWFTFSYSPLHDDDGKVAGAFCVCTETTAHVYAEHRQSFQLEMTDRLRGLSDPYEIMGKASESLGEYLGVNRVLFVDVDEERGLAMLHSNYVDGTVSTRTGLRPLDTYGQANLAELRLGRTLVIDDVLADPRARPPQCLVDFQEIATRSAIAVPIVRQGELKAVLLVNHGRPRRWPIHDVTIAEDVAERAWNAVERARAQAALRVERDRSQGVLESMAEGFVLLDHELRVLQINAEALRLEQRPASDFVGKPHTEAWPGSERWAAMRLYRRAMKKRLPVSLEQHHTFQDGRRVWIERRAYPMEEGLAVFYRDISERKTVEQSLRRLNEILEQRVAVRTADRDRVWRMSRDIFAVASLKGCFLSVNPAFTGILGWSEQEATSVPFIELVHPEQREELLERMRILAAGEPLVRYEVRDLHKDGSYRWLSWTIVPEGDLLYGVARDITAEKEQAAALRQAEEALAQSQKMEAVGQLTGGIAHDFNNLLGGMMGNLEMMEIRLGQGRAAELGRYIAAAKAVANRAAALTHRLLAFSRRQTLDPRPTDLNRLLASMAELIQRTAGPSIAVAMRFTEKECNTLCDPHQLESALLNLVINARDAMPAGGSLLLETSEVTLDDAYVNAFADVAPGEYVAISVTDTGTGMTPEVLARAFDPFFTTKPIGHGTGLGLSMIYGFVKQSGGHVRLYSEPGKGTTVRIKLPKLDREPRGEAAPEAGAPAPAGARTTVLVVDDELALREVLVEMLDLLGYEVLAAADASQGLQLAQAAPRIDLLVTDVGLAGDMNGRQFAGAARRLRPGLKVLFITGYAEKAVLGSEPLKPGMELLTKPFGMDIFAARVEAMIDVAPPH